MEKTKHKKLMKVIGLSTFESQQKGIKAANNLEELNKITCWPEIISLFCKKQKSFTPSQKTCNKTCQHFLKCLSPAVGCVTIRAYKIY